MGAKGVTTALEMLLDKNTQGAVAAIKVAIVKFGLSKAKPIIAKVLAPLPSFAKTPASTFINGMVDKLAAQHIAEMRVEYLGEAATAEDHAMVNSAFNPANLLIEKGFGLLGGVYPGLVDKMTAKLPSALEPAKKPINTGTKSMVAKTVAILQQGPSKWNKAGMGEVVVVVKDEAIKLSGELQGVAMAKVKALAGGALGEDGLMPGEDADDVDEMKSVTLLGLDENDEDALELTLED